MKTEWTAPRAQTFAGRFITLTPLDPESDADELFSSSHEPASVDGLWRHLPRGPFADVTAMRVWLHAQAATPDMTITRAMATITGRRV